MAKQAAVETENRDQSSALDSEQVLMAVGVEAARRNLANLLLESNQAAAFIANQLLADLVDGVDYSEIILIKNSDQYKAHLLKFIGAFSLENQRQADACYKPASHEDAQLETHHVVQESGFVQHDVQRVAELTSLSDEEMRMLCGFHFLPAYLIEVAGMLEKMLPIDKNHDASFVNKLHRYRHDLKTLRQQMIASNTGLVAFVAHKYKITSLSFEDLMQEGLVGLIKAVDRFDPERGNHFSTYAIFWIKQAVSRLIVKQDKVVPLPVALAEKSSVLFEAMRNCYLQKERWPTLDELKACCALSEQEIKTISSYYQATHSLDTPVLDQADEDDNMSEMAKMQQSQFSLPLDQLIESDLAQYVDKAVGSLPEKQATILAMRFGLKNHTEMTLQAVADHLHVTRERVRQIQNEALQKLKQQFGFDLMLFLEPNDS